MDRDQLTSILERLGASDPEGWADSQIREGIPQLARFLFLKGAWDRIVADADTTWIDNVLTNVPESSTDPYSGTAHSIRRLLAAGGSKEDISELVRCIQAEYLSDLCYMMDDSGSVTGNEDFVHWSLFECNDDGEPLHSIGGLHESILETDPTGREMTPQQT